METNGNRNDAKWDAFEKMMEDKVVTLRIPASGSARRSML